MKDLTKPITTITHPSLSHDEMVQLHTARESIHGFIGGLEVDTAVLKEEVPETFTNSRYTDEEGVEHVYTWEQYSRTFPSVNEGKSLIQVGHCDTNGNFQKPIPASEFTTWADHWGVENLLTKSNFSILLYREFE